MHRLLFILGTRPEAIKLAPVFLAAREHPDRFEPRLCVTAQHREMLDQVLRLFGLEPHHDLDLMTPDQSLGELTARALRGLEPVIAAERPDLVLVQGDTTTVLAGALAAFYRRVPVGHVEAGLRTFRKFAPYPEEMNRALTSRLTDIHFAPTERARANLLAEGMPEAAIHVTGNTVIDALLMVVERARRERPPIPGVAEEELAAALDRPLVAITGHRRENFGEGFEQICSAIADLAGRFPRALFVYPVHLNPNVQEPVRRTLGGLTNVRLIEPLDYLPFVRLMDTATMLLTDSGGVQEEAPSLGRPVLVMREATERPEAVEAGTVRLVGAHRATIVEETARLLTDPAAYAAMSRAHNPYGDGQASRRILTALEGFFGGRSGK